MSEETAVVEQAAEFHSDEQRDAYVRGLEHEKAGYTHRLEKAKRGRDKTLTVDELQDRIAQVDEELERVTGEDKKQPAKKATSKAKDEGDGAPDA